MPRGTVIGVVAMLVLGCVGVAVTFGTGASRNAARPSEPAIDRAGAGEGPRQPDAAAGARLFGQCAACHSIGHGGADLDGPNLYGVVSSPVAGRRPRYAYSAALRHAGGIWTTARLDAWLTRPASFAPGTTMTFAGLPDARDRADVIAFLTTQGSGSKAP